MAVGDITYTKLSASTNGRAIKVVATASAGTLVHTTGGTESFVTMDAYNSGTVEQVVVVQWGGTTSPDDHYVFRLPPGRAPVLLFDRKFIAGSLLIRVYSTTANVVIVGGYVEEVQTS